jgi:hypothetical protein
MRSEAVSSVASTLALCEMLSSAPQASSTGQHVLRGPPRSCETEGGSSCPPSSPHLSRASSPAISHLLTIFAGIDTLPSSRSTDATYSSPCLISRRESRLLVGQDDVGCVAQHDNATRTLPQHRVSTHRASEHRTGNLLPAQLDADVRRDADSSDTANTVSMALPHCAVRQAVRGTQWRPTSDSIVGQQSLCRQMR